VARGEKAWEEEVEVEATVAVLAMTTVVLAGMNSASLVAAVEVGKG
jgi:hypothetical protein